MIILYKKDEPKETAGTKDDNATEESKPDAVEEQKEEAKEDKPEEVPKEEVSSH